MPLRAGARVRVRTWRGRAPGVERARLMFLNYPNNPTGAVAPDGVFGRRSSSRAGTTCSWYTTTPIRR